MAEISIPGYAFTVWDCEGSDPCINSVSGSASHNNTITISGINFGSKTQAAPQIYDNFDSGIDSYWDNPYAMTAVTTSSYLRGSTDVMTCQGDAGTSWAVCLDQGVTNAMTPTLGGKFYLSVYYRLDGAWNWSDAGWDNGFKVMRFYGGIQNEFAWSEVGSSLYLTPNNADPAFNLTDAWNPQSNMQTQRWYHYEFFIQVPSSVNGTDGYAKIIVDGDEKTGCTLDGTDNLAWLEGLTPGEWRAYRFGWHSNSGTITNGSYLLMDDAVIDDTWARVLIGNASALANCTQIEYQPATSWSNTQIACTVNHGGFSAGTYYLFVVDENDNSSIGKEITLV